jgi:hypothetical protein
MTTLTSITEFVQNHWPILILAVLAIYYLYTKHFSEGAENTPAPQTIFAVGNAYTGLECIDDSLPIYSRDSDTYTALSIDGTNPVYRADLNIPSYIQCRKLEGTPTNLFTPWNKDNKYKVDDVVSYNDANYQCSPEDSAVTVCDDQPDKSNKKWRVAQDVNTFLAKDGIRQLPVANPPNSRFIFDKLSKDGYTTIQCNYKALNDPNHWCAKVHNSYQGWCNKLRKFSRDSRTECDSIPKYVGKSSSNTVTATLFKNLTDEEKAANLAKGFVDAATIASCSNKDCVRNKPKGMSSTDCTANCKKCGKTTC